MPGDRGLWHVATGGVDQHVEPVPALDHFSAGGLQPLPVEDVRHQRHGLPTLALYLRDDLGGPPFAAAEDPDLCSDAGEPAGHLASEGSRGPGHDRDLAGEVEEFQERSVHLPISPHAFGTAFRSSPWANSRAISPASSASNTTIPASRGM